MATETPRENAPLTPVEITVFIQDGRFVFRTDDARPIYAYDKMGGKNRTAMPCAL